MVRRRAKSDNIRIVNIKKIGQRGGRSAIGMYAIDGEAKYSERYRVGDRKSRENAKRRLIKNYKKGKHSVYTQSF